MTGVRDGLLLAVVVIQVVCALGLIAVKDPVDRLHLVGPASVFGSILLVAAVAFHGATRAHMAKVVVAGLFLWIASPLLGRATARAFRIRAEGRLVVAPDELVEDGA